jgi:hypothetical protein
MDTAEVAAADLSMDLILIEEAVVEHMAGVIQDGFGNIILSTAVVF